MNRLIGLAMAMSLLTSCVAGQSNNQSDKPTQSEKTSKSTKELTPQEANRVTLPAPKDVKAKQEGSSMVLEWKPSPQKRVVEYKVFRFDDKVDKLVEIGRTMTPNFLVEKMDGKAAYGVAAVDYRGNESPVSDLVKTPKPAAK
jgi:hypothetical protein